MDPGLRRDDGQHWTISALTKKKSSGEPEDNKISVEEAKVQFFTDCAAGSIANFVGAMALSFGVLTG
jgi:hypothetical protein